MHFPPPIYSYLNQLSSLSSKLCHWLMKGWLYLDKAAEFCYSEMSAKQVLGWTVLSSEWKSSWCIGRGSCMNICLYRCRSGGVHMSVHTTFQELHLQFFFILLGPHLTRFPRLGTWNLPTSVTHSWESQTWVNRPGSTSSTSISGFGK